MWQDVESFNNGTGNVKVNNFILTWLIVYPLNCSCGEKRNKKYTSAEIEKNKSVL